MPAPERKFEVVEGEVISRRSRRPDILMKTDDHSPAPLPRVQAPKVEIRREGLFGSNAKDLAHQDRIWETVQGYRESMLSIQLTNRGIFEASIGGAETARALTDYYEHGMQGVEPGSGLERFIQELFGESLGHIRANVRDGIGHLQQATRRRRTDDLI